MSRAPRLISSFEFSEVAGIFCFGCLLKLLTGGQLVRAEPPKGSEIDEGCKDVNLEQLARCQPRFPEGLFVTREQCFDQEGNVLDIENGLGGMHIVKAMRRRKTDIEAKQTTPARMGGMPGEESILLVVLPQIEICEERMILR